MTLIDQRILIDAPPQVIWDFISDPDKLARWHSGYSGISVLTTQRTGAGTRRRCTAADGGKDVIEEITTWVDGLGYEYTLVESAAYRSFQGRLRLQAGPDGTTVQWTVSYRRKGLIGFLQDQFKGRSRLAQMMAASLRALRRQIDELGVRMDAELRAKASIQGRLDANARAQYQRRYAPPRGLETLQPAQDASELVPAENMPLAATETSAPSFITDLAGEAGEHDYSPEADTKPRAPDGLHEAISAQQMPDSTAPAPGAELRTPAETAAVPQPEHIEPPSPPPTRETAHPSQEMLPVQLPPDVGEDEPSPWERPPAVADGSPQLMPEPEHRQTTPSHGMPPVQAMPAQERPTDEPSQPKPPPRETATDSPADTDLPASAALHRPPQTPTHDTGEISIWEVFGVKRPSEQDNETLEDLMRSVNQKETSSRRRFGGRATHQKTRVRRADSASGLRVWLALRAARIRPNAARFEGQDGTKNGA